MLKSKSYFPLKSSEAGCCAEGMWSGWNLCFCQQNYLPFQLQVLIICDTDAWKPGSKQNPVVTKATPKSLISIHTDVCKLVWQHGAFTPAEEERFQNKCCWSCVIQKSPEPTKCTAFTVKPVILTFRELLSGIKQHFRFIVAFMQKQ